MTLETPNPKPLDNQTDKFKYISFTAPEVKTSVTKLISSQRDWVALDSRTVDQPPYHDFFGTPDTRMHSLALTKMGAVSPKGTIADRIASLLLDPVISRSSESEFHEEEAGNLRKIEAAVSSNEPIRIVLPSFPGRPHNPATHRRVSPDLSEAAAISRLAFISQTVEKIYSPSIVWVIVLDGIAYAPFYGYSVDGARQYPRDLQVLIDQLGHTSSFEMLDLNDLINERRTEYDALRPKITKEVDSQWADPAYLFKEDLIRSMRMGTETSAAMAALIQLMKQEGPKADLEQIFSAIDGAVSESASRTAFEYMVMLATIKQMNLILEKVPNAIRGTLHPKPGQYAPRLTNPSTDIAPWHGVAVVDEAGEIGTVYESYIYQNRSAFTAVYVSGDYEPFYYERRSA